MGLGRVTEKAYGAPPRWGGNVEPKSELRMGKRKDRECGRNTNLPLTVVARGGNF